jgi:hypothetical protein
VLRRNMLSSHSRLIHPKRCYPILTFIGVRYSERMLQRTVFTIKSGFYHERGGILFIMESSFIVVTRETLFMLFMCVGLCVLFIRESLFIVALRKNCLCL